MGMAGALAGVTVIELAGAGPAPFAGMMLADHGARVIRIDPPDRSRLRDYGAHDITNRNRERLTLDLKDPAAVARVLDLAGDADALIEGFRPGVIERLGLGPDVLLARNPRLVVGRVTGWGQDGPRAMQVGHDVNYIALSGALHGFGRQNGKLAFPGNTLGDNGGGGMLLAFGLLAGILSARETGRGQVIDAAMVDGAALLSARTWTRFAAGDWKDERESNLIDGAAHFYDVYETADGKWISLGAIEERFYAGLLDKLGLADDPEFAAQYDQARWPALTARLEAIFRTRTRDEWCALLDGSDACFAPVLSLAEAPADPHNLARGTFVELDGVIQPAPAPRFLGTPAPAVRMEREPEESARNEEGDA
jgi:alpha-methylacyl-CoA racemase